MIKVDNVTLDGLRTTILFLIGVAAVLVSLQKGIEAWNALFRKKTVDREKQQDARLSALEDTVGELQTRLDTGDQSFEKLRLDIGELLNVQNAMLMHMITGNSIESLKDTKKSMDAYMGKR